MMCGNRLREAKLTPVEVLMTSSSWARSSPAFLPATMTSAVAASVTPLRKLLSTLVTWPAPLPPMWCTWALNVSSSGRTRASAVSLLLRDEVRTHHPHHCSGSPLPEPSSLDSKNVTFYRIDAVERHNH